MGGVRKSEYVVPNAIVTAVPLDQKTFFTAFDVIRQRSVRKPKPMNRFVHKAERCLVIASRLRLINHVNNTTRVQRPQAGGARLYCNRHALFDLRAARRNRYPPQFTLPPLLQRCHSALVNVAAFSDRKSI